MADDQLSLMDTKTKIAHTMPQSIFRLFCYQPEALRHTNGEVFHVGVAIYYDYISYLTQYTINPDAARTIDMEIKNSVGYTCISSHLSINVQWKRSKMLNLQI